MNTFRFLFKKIGGKWVKQGSGITIGNFAVISPGLYRSNHLTNGWWGTPSDEVNVTQEMITSALQDHDLGVYL